MALLKRYDTGTSQWVAMTTGDVTPEAAQAVVDATAAKNAAAASASAALIWAWGNTDANDRARYIYSPRGGGTNQIDVYDISHGERKTGKPTSPQGELFTTGSSYAYDGADTILLSRSALGASIMIMALDLKTMRMSTKMSTAFLQGTVHVGNFMEVAGGNNEFVYVLANTGTVFARALLF